MKVITLTPNPALDVSTSVGQIIPEKKLRCAAAQYHPGGGGINVSRVIQRLGGQTLAIFPVGGGTGDHLASLLEKENVRLDPVKSTTITRQSFAVTETSTALQYRFGLPGEVITDAEGEQLLERLEKHLPQADYIVASGSLPPGLPEDFYGQVALLAKQHQTRMILDTSGTPLLHALKVGVFLIKPNLGELATITNRQHISGPEQEKLAMQLVESGKASVVVISMGARGAMLASQKRILYRSSPTVSPKSTIGAGDSMVAGMVYALANKKAMIEVLTYGVACGTATTMREGTGLCQPEDVKQVLEWMNVGSK